MAFRGLTFGPSKPYSSVVNWATLVALAIVPGMLVMVSGGFARENRAAVPSEAKSKNEKPLKFFILR